MQLQDNFTFGYKYLHRKTMANILMKILREYVFYFEEDEALSQERR